MSSSTWAAGRRSGASTRGPDAVAERRITDHTGLDQAGCPRQSTGQADVVESRDAGTGFSRSTRCTLGAALERDRLERRARLLTLAVAELRSRATYQRRTLGAPSRHITLAIRDFEAQATEVNDRLERIARDDFENPTGVGAAMPTAESCPRMNLSGQAVQGAE